MKLVEEKKIQIIAVLAGILVLIQISISCLDSSIASVQGNLALNPFVF